MWPRNIAIISIAAAACSMCATCICPRVFAIPGAIWFSTMPETATSTPGSSRPPQNISFPPAWKGCAGPSRPPNIPPKRTSHFQSPSRGRLSRAKVRMTISSVTANSGPTKLCIVLST